jgi:type 2 lantibiotic biosynthesis protein LanM
MHMRFTDAELRTLVARAATHDERLGQHFTPQSDPLLAERRLNAWRKNAAANNPRRFARRLAVSSWSEAEAIRAVSAATLVEDAPLPDWAQLLNELLNTLPFSIAALPHTTADALPFEEALYPFVDFSLARLRANVDYTAIKETALIGAAQGLQASLSELVGRTLFYEFSVARAAQLSGKSQAELASLSGNNIYRAWLESLLAGGWRALILNYPVLGRLMATICQMWLHSTGNLLVNLKKDRPQLEKIFADGAPLGNLVDIKANLSDRHNHGEMVSILTFASGLKLVYKPKDLAIDFAFGQMAAWLNQHTDLSLRTPRILHYADYGWVEFIPHRPAPDTQAAAAYYRRAGALMALIYVLGSTDFHRENVIAAGDCPMLIDMELSFSPNVRPYDGLEEIGQTFASDWMINASVLGSGLLSGWASLPNGQSADIAGLGAETKQALYARGPKWYNVNQDTMNLREGEHALDDKAHILYIGQIGGLVAAPGDYISAIQAGFAAAYKVMLKDGFAVRSMMAEMADATCRFVLRHTTLYKTLHTNSTRPEFMRDGADRGVYLESLTRGLVLTEMVHPMVGVLPYELAACYRLDVPMLTFSPNQNILHADVPIQRPFNEAAIDLAYARLDNLSQADLEMQNGFIQAALITRFSFANQDPVGLPQYHPPTPPQLPEASQLLAQAEEIADDIAQKAIRVSDGAIWVQAEFIPSSGRYEFLQMGYDTYHGLGGAAIYLAMAGQALGKPNLINLALAAMSPIRQEAHLGMGRLSTLGVGGLDGLGGVIYALTRLGHTLGDDTLFQDAAKVAHLIKKEAIAADTRFDVLGGCAGAILALLALHQNAPMDLLLALASQCADHLLTNRTTDEKSGLRAWVTLEKQMLAGFLHGAAGIAYALAKLGQATGTNAYLDAAREAFAYEDTLYDSVRGGWLDLRPSMMLDGQYHLMPGFCHGAPGIGAARASLLGASNLLPNAGQNVAAAAGFTARPELYDGTDILCCGNMGRIDCLLTMGQATGQTEYVQTAQARAAWVLGRVKEYGQLFLSVNLPASVDPISLYQGRAGVGYVLLRLTDPNAYPSLLLMAGQ